MTTLSAVAFRDLMAGDDQEYPVIASDIIYQGAAVGKVVGTGLARPLVGGDTFLGFAIATANNASGAASAINVNTKRRGVIKLAVTGAVITDVGLAVYATDDNTFTFSPVGASFVGFASRFISSGYMMVAFDIDGFIDPNAGFVWETVADNLTLDIQDNGKGLYVTADAKTITLPATAVPTNCRVMNGGAFGTIAVNISPNASDKIQGPNIAGTDNKDLINTKATANRGDFADLTNGDTGGPLVSKLVGTWATEA